MNTHKLSLITINKLNSLCKNFLWNATITSTKKSPINLQSLSYPKNMDGGNSKPVYFKQG